MTPQKYRVTLKETKADGTVYNFEDIVWEASPGMAVRTAQGKWAGGRYSDCSNGFDRDSSVTIEASPYTAMEKTQTLKVFVSPTGDSTVFQLRDVRKSKIDSAHRGLVLFINQKELSHETIKKSGDRQQLLVQTVSWLHWQMSMKIIMYYGTLEGEQDVR